ncbi:hypothetical protein Ddye_015986 [Dipteronia dyeriana]|uniref:Uncharacterized protein n=1 Tax=Dipteronia dyeriana TaxID=168575 RepID=A0AAD9WZU0_9ROSI|nr:hypothetical protein Ddye_015986 [Dipteronia dyeriana]
MAEARAFLEGILVAVHKGLFPLEVESDALNVAIFALLITVLDGLSHGVKLLCDSVFPDWLLRLADANVSGFLPSVAW